MADNFPNVMENIKLLIMITKKINAKQTSFRPITVKMLKIKAKLKTFFFIIGHYNNVKRQEVDICNMYNQQKGLKSEFMKIFYNLLKKRNPKEKLAIKLKRDFTTG